MARGTGGSLGGRIEGKRRRVRNPNGVVTKASALTIHRPDGTTEVQPRMTIAQANRIINRGKRQPKLR